MSDQTGPLRPAAGRRTTLRLEAVPDHQAPRDQNTRRIIVVAILILIAIFIGTLVAHVPRAPDHLAWADIAPPATTPLHPWRWIVIHHTANPRSASLEIDRDHQQDHGWDGIGYHFIIGNGTDLPLGHIDATSSWRLQNPAGRTGSDPAQAAYNQDGIGICLVGNFDNQPLDTYQEKRLVDLCTVLVDHVPTLSVSHIIGHRDIPGTQTDCPGTLVDLERIRFLVRRQASARGVPGP